MGHQSDHTGDKVDDSVGAIKPGGITDQVLTKRSNTDYDVEWKDGSIPPGTSPGEYFTFTPVALAGVANASIFIDSADNKLKYKDVGGVVKEIMLGPYNPSTLLTTDATGQVTGLDMSINGGKVPIITPDGFNLTVLGTGKDQELIAWSVFKSNVPVEDVDPGLEAFSVPFSPLSGYILKDVMVGCGSIGAGTVSVNILKNSIEMLTTPVTLTNTLYADLASSGGVVADPPASIVNRGDRLFYKVTLSGTAPNGLFITAVLQAT